MTIRQAMQIAQQSLLPSNEDARFDVLCLAEKAWGCTPAQLRLHAQQSVQPEEFFALVRRRQAGEPLQYILGEWEFYGLRFAVGPGVLVPRPETELLVQLALEYLQGLPDKACTVYDLCAGSGCAGLSIAHHCPQAQVKLLELSGEALPYLRENAKHYPNAEVIQADILHCPLSIINFTLVVSNPPYVRAGEIDGLRREVQQEPRMALDGGADGLVFYRALAAQWLPRLAPGGMLACECGEGQAGEIAAMFAPFGTVKRLRDFNAVERVIAVMRENA